MRTVERAGESSLTIERSRFLGYCVPVSSESDAEEFIRDLRRKHAQARHIVYVYKIEPDIVKKYNSSEPSGTGAPPIYSIIEARGLTNVLVAVVRYFGGVLLGTGGLVRAYSDSASEAIDDAKTKELTKYYKYKIRVPYGSVSDVENAEWVILDRKYDEQVEYIVASRVREVPYQDAEFLEEIWL